jgi:spore coat protein U-like protein
MTVGKRIGLTLALVIGAWVLAPERGALAQTATTAIPVSATVVASCTITTTTAIAFGNYDPVVANATTPLDVNGAITVACTSGAATTIGMNQGLTPTGTSTAAAPLRQMASGAVNRMRYDIYQDAARTTIWSDSSTPGAAAYNSVSFAPATLNVYARIPSGQNVATGAYTDTVTATINF